MTAKQAKTTASIRREKDDQTTAAIKAMVEGDRKRSLEKTDKLRALRLAKEAAEAETEAAKVKPEKVKKSAKAS